MAGASLDNKNRDIYHTWTISDGKLKLECGFLFILVEADVAAGTIGRHAVLKPVLCLVNEYRASSLAKSIFHGTWEAQDGATR